VFDCPVGLSDHHVGNEMMLAASALGASVLEKGVCADDAPFDQDVNHAMRMSEVGPLLRSSKLIHQALGSPMRSLKRDRPKPAARMGLVARANLPAGAVISLETVDFAWPARGIPVEDWSQVTGWRLRKAVSERMPIKWSDVEAMAS